jgi:pyruvate carboxylase subunit B
MPGRVVRVLVAVGDRVTAGQGVVVVEAMKMENDLRTPTDGVVKEILVVPGAAVDSGAVLIVVDQ